MPLDESWIYGLLAYMLPLRYSNQTYKGKETWIQVPRVALPCFNLCVGGYSAITWKHRIHGIQATSHTLCHVMNHKT